MNDPRPWWRQESRYFLNETLAFINSSRSRDEAIGRCEELCKGLNKTWNAFFRYRKRNGQLNAKELANEDKGQRSDNQSFQAFMLHGLPDPQVSALFESESVRFLAELTPHIMNHDTLLKEQYDPFNIADEVRKKASDEHRQLLKAFQRYLEATSDPTLKVALLKKSAQLIYVVRSNIAHSEKTPQGPDLAKSERDRAVSEATARLIEDMFDILFDGPSQRLAVYGTLAPDGANASELAELDGQWHEGTVKGVVEQRDGFLEFHWRVATPEVPVKVFSAPQLKERLHRLDRFEGSRYQRILVPVGIGGEVCVCNIYQGKRAASTRATSSA